MSLERAQLVERVDHGVLIAADREARAGVGERPRRPDAVGEVALGGRAEADRAVAAAQQFDVAGAEVRARARR